MIFSRKLYLGEGVKHPAVIKYKLRAHKLSQGTYVIRIAENESDYLEILQAAYYLQPLAHHEKNYIVGFAASYDEAVSLVEKMMKDCLSDTGGVNLRRYLIQLNQGRE